MKWFLSLLTFQTNPNLIKNGMIRSKTSYYLKGDIFLTSGVFIRIIYSRHLTFSNFLSAHSGATLNVVHF